MNHKTRRAIDYAAKGRLSRLSVDKCWEVIDDLAKYEEEEWEYSTLSEEGVLNHMSTTQEQMFVNIQRQVEELMKAEASLVEGNASEFLSTTGGHTPPHFSRQEEFEGIMLTFMENQEKQIQELEIHLKSTHDVFMELANKFISKIEEKIREEASHKKIEKIFELPTPNNPCDEGDADTPFPNLRH